LNRRRTRWFDLLIILSIILIHFTPVMTSDGGNAPLGMVLRAVRIINSA
jgi:hypothetical protein